MPAGPAPESALRAFLRGRCGRLIRSAAVATLGHSVGDAEARLFVGRDPEFVALAALVADLKRRPVALYISAAPGLGKSALLRAYCRWADAHEIPSLMVDVAGGDGAATLSAAVTTTVARHVNGDTSLDPAECAREAVVGLQRVAASRPFLLVLDGYDRLAGGEPWFREHVLSHLGPGVGVIMTGRTPPARLWADAPAWAGAVRTLTLGPLPPGDSLALLDRMRVRQAPVTQIALEVAGGHPHLLVRAGAAIAADPAWAVDLAATQPERFRLFLIERILHPDSRRRAWRATGTDEVLAAAGLLPHIDRLALTAALGRTAVDRAWPVLAELAGSVEAGGQPALPPPLRKHLAAAALLQRPWAERRWRRLAIEHLVNRAQDRPPGTDAGQDWLAIAALTREAEWYPFLFPAAEAAEGWQIAASVEPTSKSWAWEAVVRDAGGVVLGQAFAAALTPAASYTDRAVASFIEGLPPDVRGRWVGTTLALGFGEVVRPEVAGVLLREGARLFARCDRVVVLHPRNGGGVAEQALPALGFRCDDRWTERCAWVLEFGQDRYGGWLQRIAWPSVAGPRPAEETTRAAKEALASLHEPANLTKALAAVAPELAVRPAAVIRAWLLDAIHSCGLSKAQVAVLTQYYVERAGSHEDLATRLDLPRATYYRLHKQALERLGAELFA